MAQLDAMRRLLDEGVEVDRETEEAEQRRRVAQDMASMSLFDACKNGRTDVVQAWLDNGADVNRADEDSATPLYIACQNGHVDAALLLLDKGADVNRAAEDEPLDAPRHNSSFGLGAALLFQISHWLAFAPRRPEVLVDPTGATPLFIACQQGHVDVATLLLDKGAEVDKANKNGATPLYIACNKGHVDAAQLLREKGAKADAAPLSDAKKRFLHSAIARLPPPPKVLVHESWYDDTAARTDALETKLTEYQKELRRLKPLLTERETDSLTCPITYEIYEDPVIAADGHSYERRERCPHQATVVF